VQKMAQRVAKQVAQKIITSVAAFLAANPEIVAIIVAIAAVIIFFIIIFIAITGQSSPSTNGVSPQPGPPPPVQGQSLTCINGDYKTCLSDDFNISASGDLPSNGLQIIFGIIANAASSTTYKDLLTCGGRTIPIVVTNSSGASLSYGVITLNGFFSSRNSLGSQTQLLIHELGHQIFNHNCGRIQQAYNHSTLVSKDPTCYDNGYLITYALRSPYRACDKEIGAGGINGEGESFAETLGDYVAYKSYAGAANFYCSIHLGTAYKNTCINTYNWTKDNVFDGIEF
jgi:hypothetical protein